MTSSSEDPRPDDDDFTLEPPVERGSASSTPTPTSTTMPNNPTASEASTSSGQQTVKVILQPRGTTLLKLFAFTGWALATGFLVGMLVLWGGHNEYFDNSQGITEQFHSGNPNATSKVAVLHVSGVIMTGEGYVRAQIDRIREDSSIKAVVLRIDSPGGTVTGSDYIHHHLKQLIRDRKAIDGIDLPVVVSMGSMAASGGYYVAMAAGDQQAIYAEPTTTTGSIGVIIPHYDLSGLMKQHGVKDDSIKSHPRKQMLSITREMRDEDREILQEYVNQSFNRFKKIVLEGRPDLPESELDKLATGEIFTATQAKESGLVDEIGFIEEAILRAATKADLLSEQDKKDGSYMSVRVVEYSRPENLAEILGVAQAGGAPVGMEALFDISSPRAYYLATSLPTLVRSKRAE